MVIALTVLESGLLTNIIDRYQYTGLHPRLRNIFLLS